MGGGVDGGIIYFMGECWVDGFEDVEGEFAVEDDDV